jgi:threonine dehydrogenase-like Zn-dependent dehydrogenase
MMLPLRALKQRLDRDAGEPGVKLEGYEEHFWNVSILLLLRSDDIDPSFVVTHPASPEDAPAMYKKFRDKEDGVIKVVLRPGS